MSICLQLTFPGKSPLLLFLSYNLHIFRECSYIYASQNGVAKLTFTYFRGHQKSNNALREEMLLLLDLYLNYIFWDVAWRCGVLRAIYGRLVGHIVTKFKWSNLTHYKYSWPAQRSYLDQQISCFKNLTIFVAQVHSHMKLFKFETRHRPIQDGDLTAILVVSETTWALSGEQFFFMHVKLFKFEKQWDPIYYGLNT